MTVSRKAAMARLGIGTSVGSSRHVEGRCRDAVAHLADERRRSTPSGTGPSTARHAGRTLYLSRKEW
jgi:hypothetical protein